jgi:hypothetical protein
MVSFLRHFFTYVPPEPPPEVPEEEPPDPAKDRALTDAYRRARQTLVATCALCIGWSTAQFGLVNRDVSVGGVSIDISTASIPVLLSVAFAYFSLRWIVEFGMMPRNVRRWRLAQLDFRLVLALSRVTILVLAAGAIERSSTNLFAVGVMFLILFFCVAVLTVLLMFLTMPVRVIARRRAERESAANAAYEALFWAGFFAVCLTVVGAVVAALLSYRYDSIRVVIWRGVPHPLSLAFFTIIVIAIFLSHWLFRPIMIALFAKRPNYRTKRTLDGCLIVNWVSEKEEPLL